MVAGAAGVANEKPLVDGAADTAGAANPKPLVVVAGAKAGAAGVANEKPPVDGAADAADAADAATDKPLVAGAAARAAGGAADDEAADDWVAVVGMTTAAGAAVRAATGEASALIVFSKRGRSSASTLAAFSCAACSAVRPFLVIIVMSAPASRRIGTHSSHPSDAA